MPSGFPPRPRGAALLAKLTYTQRRVSLCPRRLARAFLPGTAPKASRRANPATDREDQVVALKFLLHFVGDIHQPFCSSDDMDRGGNNKKASATGFRAGNLHPYWDTEFVDRLETDPKSIASDLIGHISRDQISA